MNEWKETWQKAVFAAAESSSEMRLSGSSGFARIPMPAPIDRRIFFSGLSSSSWSATATEPPPSVAWWRLSAADEE